MGNKTITLNGNLLRKCYKIRTTGKNGKSIETSIPKEVFEREARRQGLTVEEALNKLQAVWQYDGFAGLFLSFEPKKDQEAAEQKDADGKKAEAEA
jgi:hypothetical protein